VAAKIVFIATALIIAVGGSTWALAWAYRKHVEASAETRKARYERDEAMVGEAEREVKKRER